MDQGTKDQQKQNQGSHNNKQPDTKEQRLAKALKQNLRRRKQPRANTE